MVLLMVILMPLSLYSKDGWLPPELAPFDGKLFSGGMDQEFRDYDLALRKYLSKRIQRQFGLNLNPQAYSGFELLEIEALFRCKKSGEPFNLFLKMFPRTQ